MVTPCAGIVTLAIRGGQGALCGASARLCRQLQRRDILCQPARDHQGGRTAQLFLNALGDAVQQNCRAQHRARKHTALSVHTNGCFGGAQPHLRQLGTALPQSPQAGGKPRADHTAPEYPVLIHNIKCSGSAHIHGDDRQREIRRSVSGIHQPVLAHGMGVRHPHGQACADSPAKR